MHDTVPAANNTKQRFPQLSGNRTKLSLSRCQVSSFTMNNADIIIRQCQLKQNLCSAKAPQWDYIPPTPALEAKGLTAHKLGEIIENINNEARSHVNEEDNSLYMMLAILPIIGCPFACYAVNENIKHVNAVRIAIAAMKEYVEITLNEHWQKDCGIRWTVATEQTLSGQTWYNIEVRILNQEINLPRCVPSEGPVEGDGMEGKCNTVERGTVQSVPPVKRT